MRSPSAPVLATLAAAVIVGVLLSALLLGGGDEPRQIGRASRLHVDPESLGGRCSDDRSAAEVRSSKAPWCTLRRAVGEAPPGATVLLRRARYPQVLIERDPSRPLRLRSFPGERAELTAVEVDGGGVRLERLHITGTVSLRPGVTRVALVGNRWVTDGRSGGTNLNIGAGVRDVLVEANRISQRGATAAANAINFSSTDQLPPIRKVTLRNNRIGPIKGGGDAIQAKNTRSLVVERNEILGLSRPPGSSAHPDAFQSIYGTAGLVLRRNFIHDIAAQGIVVQLFRGRNAGVRVADNVIARVASPWTALGVDASPAVITHNTIDGKALIGPTSTGAVVANVASWALIIDAAARIDREQYNLSSRFGGPSGQGSIVGIPRFRDPAGDDFRLVPGTPGAEAGPGGSSVGARAANLSGTP